MDHHRQRPPGREPVAVRHGDRPPARAATTTGVGMARPDSGAREQALDQRREVGAGVGEQIVDPAQAQGREQRFGRGRDAASRISVMAPPSRSPARALTLACRFVLSCRRTREKGKPMTNQELLAGLAAALASGGIRVVDLTQPLRASHAGDPAAAAARALAAVPHGGDLALRRARPRLVLEQHLLRRAYRHPFRRAGALDHRPRAGRTPTPTPSRRSS